MRTLGNVPCGLLASHLPPPTTHTRQKPSPTAPGPGAGGTACHGASTTAWMPSSMAASLPSHSLLFFLNGICRPSISTTKTPDFIFLCVLRLPRETPLYQLRSFSRADSSFVYRHNRGADWFQTSARGMGGRSNVANQKPVPDDHCIAALFAPCSVRGMAGAEAGKRNIPGSTACLRPIQEHMSSPQIEARLSHHTGLGLSTHTCIARCRAISSGKKVQSAKLSSTHSAWHVDTPNGSESDSTCVRLAVSAPLLTSAAQTCCAPIGDVGPVEEASRRQGDMFLRLFCRAFSTRVVVRSLCLHAANPQLLDYL
jgi:hypothetical protein